MREPSCEVGDWVLFARENRLVIGQILHCRYKARSGYYDYYTTEGMVSESEVLEKRSVERQESDEHDD